MRTALTPASPRRQWCHAQHFSALLQCLVDAKRMRGTALWTTDTSDEHFRCPEASPLLVRAIRRTTWAHVRHTYVFWHTDLPAMGLFDVLGYWRLRPWWWTANDVGDDQRRSMATRRLSRRY